MRALFVIITVIGCTLSILSCQQKSRSVLVSSGREISSTQREDLLGVDFSDQIATLSYLKRDSSDDIEHLVGSVAANVPLKYSEDERILGAYKAADGNRYYMVSDVEMPLAKYMLSHNDTPATGIDLFPELLTQDGLNEFFAMEPEVRFRRYSSGINLYTGRFFRSFGQDPPLDLGGVFIERLVMQDGKYIQDGHPTQLVERDGSPVPVEGTFKISFYGHREGEMLFSDTCSFTYEDCIAPGGQH
jgi:hypothetical protein